jgi:hypothetical protein
VGGIYTGGLIDFGLQHGSWFGRRWVWLSGLPVLRVVGI